MRRMSLLVVFLCLFIGVAQADNLVNENFAAGIPGAWTNLNNGGTCVWTSPGTGTYTINYFGDALFAEANSDACGIGSTMDTILAPPAVDGTAYTNLHLTFDHYFYRSTGDVASVVYSLDGGATWNELESWTDNLFGASETYDLYFALGEPDFVIGFQYVSTGWHWYWGVDKLLLTGDPIGAGVHLAASADDGGMPGADVVYSVKAFNNTGSKATFTIAYSGTDWAVDGPAGLEIADGESEYFDVTVSIPTDVRLGRTETLTLEISGGGDDNTLDINTTAGLNFTLGRAADTGVSRPGAAYDDGNIYLVGGEDSSDGRPGILQIYDIDGDTWSASSHIMPTPVSNVCAGAYDGKIYAAGGIDEDGNTIDALQIYDVAGDSWSLGEPLPVVVWGAGCAMVDDKLYVIGGYNAAGIVVSRVSVYDSAADTWSAGANLPSQRGYPAVTAYNGLIYIVGGKNLLTFESNTAWAFDPAAGTYEELEPLNTARAAAGLVAVYNYLIVFGGGWSEWLDSAEFYRLPDKGSWGEYNGALNVARRTFGYVQADNVVYAIAGWNGNFLNSVEYAAVPDTIDDDDDDNDDNDNDDNDDDDNDDDDDTTTDDDDNDDNDDTTTDDDATDDDATDDDATDDDTTDIGDDDDDDDDGSCCG